MKRAAIFAVLVLCDCRKTSDPDALTKALESKDQSERESAAKKLHEVYARDHAALGDHGEAYWKTLLTLAKTDKTALEQVKKLEVLPRNESSGVTTTRTATSIFASSTTPMSRSRAAASDRATP